MSVERFEGVFGTLVEDENQLIAREDAWRTWGAMKCDLLPKAIDAVVFDCAFHDTCRAASYFIGQVLNKEKKWLDYLTFGRVEDILGRDETSFVKAFNAQRLEYIRHNMQACPKYKTVEEWETYINGLHEV